MPNCLDQQTAGPGFGDHSDVEAVARQGASPAVVKGERAYCGMPCTAFQRFGHLVLESRRGMHSKAVPGELSVPFLDHDLDAAVHISADVASIQQIVVLGIENSNFLALNAVLHEFELDRNTATNSELPLIFRQAA